MHRRLGGATLSPLAFPGKSNPNFPWEKSHWDNTVVIIIIIIIITAKKKKKKKNQTDDETRYTDI